MKSAVSQFPCPRPSRAFSLLELLVVIGIIAILSTLAMVGFNSINRGAGVRGAADLAASMVRSARMEAIAEGRGALLVVDNEGSEDEKWRRIAIYRAVEDPADSAQSIFELVGRPTALPANTFLLPPESRGSISTNLVWPGSPSRSLLAWEFNGAGHFEPPSGQTNASQMVFGLGPLDASGNPTTEQGEVTRAGIVLRKNGRAIPFEPATSGGTNQ